MTIDQAEAPSQGVTKLIFTLVHGTFALRSRWVSDDTDPERFRSKIRQEFGDEYEIEYEVINWGGEGIRRLWDNTHRRRRYGAKQLTDHLKACADLENSTRRYIVTHSHAGNIAMYSLRNPEVRPKVSGLITLAAPFLKSDLDPFNRSLLGFSAIFIALVAFDANFFLAWAYGIFYISIVLTVLLSGNLGEDEKSIERISAHLEELRFPDRAEFESSSGRLSLLVIRSRLDEVRNLLGVSGFVARSFRYVWTKINQFGNYAIGFYFLLLVPSMVLDVLPWDIDISWLESLRGQLDKYVLTPMLVGVTVFLAIMAIARLFFAFDGIRWIPSFRIRSDILPWEGVTPKILPIFGFGHTKVQDESPPVIAEWVKESLSAEVQSDLPLTE